MTTTQSQERALLARALKTLQEWQVAETLRHDIAGYLSAPSAAPSRADLMYEWLAPKLSTGERKALDEIYAATRPSVAPAAAQEDAAMLDWLEANWKLIGRTADNWIWHGPHGSWHRPDSVHVAFTLRDAIRSARKGGAK